MMNKKMVFLFIFSGLAVFLLLIYGAAERQGWFESTEQYTLKFPTGDGVFPGTTISITGLRAGSVKKVELNENNEVLVRVNILSKFSSHIRKDSVVEMGRHFVIGERYISISSGSKDQAILAPGSILEGKVNLEITDLLSGNTLGRYIEVFHELMTQLSAIVKGDGKDNKDLLSVYKQTFRSLVAVEKMGNVIGNPNTENLLVELGKNAESLTTLVRSLEKTMPQLGSLAGNADLLLPQLAKTLQESTFTLQALQRSFLLRGAARELKEDLAKEANKEVQSEGPRPASVD